MSLLSALASMGNGFGGVAKASQGFMPVQPGQMPELEDRPQTMLDAIMRRGQGGSRSILGNLGGLLKNPEALNYIGAALKDIGGEEGNLAAAQQNVMVRQEQAKRQAAQDQTRQAINAAMQGAYAEDGKFDPMLFARGLLGSGALTDPGDIMSFAEKATPQAPKPQYIEGPDGIYEIVEGQSRRVQDYPQQPRPAPAGYQWNGDRLEFIPGGPGDPRVAGSLAGARRAPPRAGSGARAGGASIPPPPPGFSIVRP